MRTSTNPRNYASYIQFMLVTPMSHGFLRYLAIGYEYKKDTDTSNILKDATTKDLHLVGKINHEIINKIQGLPPSFKIDIKLQTAPSSFNLQNVVGTVPSVTVSLTSEILYVREQQVMSSIALVVEKLRASGNNIKLLVPHTIKNQRHIDTGTHTYTDSSHINGGYFFKTCFGFYRRCQCR